MRYQIRNLFQTFLLIILLLQSGLAQGSRFVSSYPCQDLQKSCEDKKGQVIDGVYIEPECWEYSYTKTCSYPSKDDCKNWGHCYAVAQLECLLTDSLGNCVNIKREFSCKSWDPVTLENQTARMDLIEKDGQDGLVCKGIPCIDGNCVDKSYMTNGEMMDSVSKLYATSKMQPDKDGNFNLFQGTSQHCSKKATGYSNCCQVESKGWGGNIGAGCNSDEKHLMEQRAKNLCKYVGKQNKGRLNVVVKHHFCCFPTMLDKVIQVEGRKQLGLNFGSGGNANCRGLTLEEIQRLDFSQMDFTEFIEDFKLKFAGRYKSPKPGELGGIASSSQAKLRRYDGNPNNQVNNMTGWHGDAKDDSWEAEEEARIERERLAELERQRLAKLEAERLERERLAKLEAERLERERLAQIEAERQRVLEAQKQAKLRERKYAEELRNWGKAERSYFHNYFSEQYFREIGPLIRNEMNSGVSYTEAKGRIFSHYDYANPSNPGNRYMGKYLKDNIAGPGYRWDGKAIFWVGSYLSHSEYGKEAYDYTMKYFGLEPW